MAAVAIALAAASLPFNEVSATNSAVRELGSVGPDGVALSWEAWEELKTDLGSSAEKSQREYERCRNPGPGLGDLIRIGERLGGGRRFPFRFPLQDRRPARDCGKPPVISEISNDARLVAIDTSRASNDQRFPVVAQLTFRRSGLSIVPGSESLGGRCVALSDSRGRLVPVRSLRDPDPYGFSNPFTQNSVVAAERRVEVARARIAAAEAKLSQDQSGIGTMAGYSRRVGQCVAPPTATPPPRPSSMSETEIEDQAAGACVDLAIRRHDPARVIGALRSIRWDAMLASMRRYQQKPASCAGVMPTQWNDVGIRMACAISDIGCYGAIQTAIQQCQAMVRNSCGAPLMEWKRRVAAIQAAPAEAKAQCEAKLQTVSNNSQQLTALRAELHQAETALSEARAAPVQSGSLPLSEARCGG
jgi:hypothetical protein